MAAEFSTIQFFPNDRYEAVVVHVEADEAMKVAVGLIQSVGGRVGTTARVIITDRDDFVTFEWKHGEGVVFPPPSVP